MIIQERIMAKKMASKNDGDSPNPDTDNAVPKAQRDITLSEEEAIASSPANESVCGEEDPGAGLEYLVNSDELGSSASAKKADRKKP